jgi:hypothetical protein
MIQQNELITFLVGLGVALYILANFSRLRTIPNSRFLIGSYFALLTGWALTILEGFLLPTALNTLEHLSYAACSVLAALWCRVTFGKDGDQG